MNLTRKLATAMAAAVLLGTLAAAEGAPEKNLIYNGDMAKVDKYGNPAGWTFQQKDGKTVQIEGKNAVEYNGALSRWGIRLPKAPGRYRIRFYVKKENKKWLGVRLFIRDKDKKEIPAKNLTKYFTDAYPEWTQLEFTADVPENAVQGGIIFSTHGGVMTIGDVSLTLLEDTPPASAE